MTGMMKGLILSVIFQLFSVLGKSESTDNNVNITGCPIIISREEWGALNVTGCVRLRESPAPYVVIHHGGTREYCHTKESCSKIVKSYQNYHMGKGWLDIGYHFVIGEDGNAYKGREWDYSGAHDRELNDRSIGICIIGNFSNFLPNTAALITLQSLIECGVEMKKIDVNYKLVGHRQSSNTLCPGDMLYQYIQKLPHWTNNRSKFYK